MEILRDTNGDIEIINITGSLDSNTSTEFEENIYSVIEEGAHRMIFNLETMDYISSAGIRVMLKVAKELKRREGLVVLCALQDYVKEVFHIAGFDAYLNIEPHLDAAMDRF
jgi:anti-sigma B factor antagonist